MSISVLSRVTLVLALAAPFAAEAANPVVKAIEQARPCSRLKVSKFGLTVGLDQFESAEVKSLKLDIDGASAKFALLGSLACRTSDGSLLRGDAKAELNASFQLDLESCAFAGKSIRIVSTGGTFGPVLDAARPEIEAALERSLEGLAKSLCK